MDAIDDALSAARGAHYGVIAGCAAALLFATTPDRTAPYRAAREDLQALAAINWDTVIFRAEHDAQLKLRNDSTVRSTNDSTNDSTHVWRQFLISAGGGEIAYLDAAFRPLDVGWRGEVRHARRGDPRAVICSWGAHHRGWTTGVGPTPGVHDGVTYSIPVGP